MGMDMNNMMDRLGKVKKRLADLQQELKTIEVVAQDENGMITAVANGSGQILDYRLNADFMEAIGQKELITALVTATNQALKQAHLLETEKKQSIVDKLNIPNVPGLFDE